MEILVLIFAHLLGDYPLQGPFLSTEKGNNPILLLTHAAIWTGTILTALYLLGYSVDVFDVIWLLTIHAIADYLKAKNKWFYKKLDSLRGGLIVDQCIHIAQIIILLAYKSL